MPLFTAGLHNFDILEKMSKGICLFPCIFNEVFVKRILDFFASN